MPQALLLLKKEKLETPAMEGRNGGEKRNLVNPCIS